ncbi:hypothetical protein [Flavobacterium foetidum]|uniref:hypothetical protein n=1 Tax=Flavobacterium foetidum TaxID=2026681 RepID=UPI001074EFD5|nr:hypothetical protein [Flavobacterium foetidum]KAF2513957.1 hypothetical protein E0W73_14115 [Flavobacterium foetidum]
MKKFKSFALMTLFVSTSLLTSCSSDSGSDDQGNEPSQGDYWPAAVGNQWVLNNGSDISMKIIGTEKIGQSTYYKFDKFLTPSSSDITGSATAWLKKTGGDYYIKLDDIVTNSGGISSKISGYEYTFFKDNLEVNGTWTGTYTQTTTIDIPGVPAIKMNVKYTGTILEKGATAVVKNVTYKDVIKFKLKLETSVEGKAAGTSEAEYWMSKDVGLVKFIFNKVASDLVSYKLN